MPLANKTLGIGKLAYRQNEPNWLAKSHRHRLGLLQSALPLAADHLIATILGRACCQQVGMTNRSINAPS